MAYDVYLKHGLPIASGVIEGGCRSVVKDCMERSGMRWVVPRVRAMLDMRCIDFSTLWEEFTAFRIDRESQCLYSGSAANDANFRKPLAARQARTTGCTHCGYVAPFFYTSLAVRQPLAFFSSFIPSRASIAPRLSTLAPI